MPPTVTSSPVIARNQPAMQAPEPERFADFDSLFHAEPQALVCSPTVRRKAVLREACVGGLTMAGSFGLAGALHNAARASAHPAARFIAVPSPLVAAGLSAWLEPRFERLFGGIPTRLPTSPYALTAEAMTYQSLLPACFMGANYLWQALPVAKPLPGTLAGCATTLAVSAVGSFVGRGAMEACAQDAQAHHGPPDGTLPYTLRRPEQLGMGRALSQVPASMLHLAIAAMARGGPVPAEYARLYPAAMGVPYAFRGVLTPPYAGYTPPANPPFDERCYKFYP